MPKNATLPRPEGWGSWRHISVWRMWEIRRNRFALIEQVRTRWIATRFCQLLLGQIKDTNRIVSQNLSLESQNSGLWGFLPRWDPVFG